MKKFLKNQKGLTLVELLAVIVILGIIAAIAVPAIANIIDNSRKDAQFANAEALYDAARLAVVAEDERGERYFYATSTDGDVTAEDEVDLVGEGYLDAVPENPLSDTAFDDAFVRYDDGEYFITLEAGDDSYFDGNDTIETIRGFDRDHFDEE